MSILHNWTCQDCGQVINGPHTNLPDEASRRRADELRAEGWDIRSMDPGCTWHGYWSMRQDSEWPAWHGALTLEDLLALADSTPPDLWEDRKEWGLAYAERRIARQIDEAAAPAPRPAPVVQLSLFA